MAEHALSRFSQTDSICRPVSARRFPKLTILSANIGEEILERPTIWDFSPRSMTVCFAERPESLEIGATLILDIVWADQSFSIELEIVRVEQTFGSYWIALGTYKVPVGAPSNLQRRSALRLSLGMFPVICTFPNGLDANDEVVCRVVDVSFGGVGLTTSLRNRCLIPGLDLIAVVRTPFDGTYKAALSVRDVSIQYREGVASSLRLHCQSPVGGTLQRPIQLHVTRFSTDSLRTKVREKFIPRTFDSLIEHHIVDPIETAKLQLGSPLGDSAQRHVTARHALFGVVGTLSGQVASITLAEPVARTGALKFDLVSERFLDGLSQSELSKARTNFLKRHSAALLGHTRPRKHGAFHTSYAEPSRRLRTIVEGLQFGGVWNPWMFFSRVSRDQSVSWDKYARAYDVMCSVNPAYQENVTQFRNWLQRTSLPPRPRVCDVGAGTGNYLLEVASLKPDAEITHLDVDPGMNSIASDKYRKAGIRNVAFELASIDEARFESGTFDLVLCVNALYTFADPTGALRRMRSWLVDGGLMYIIDLGRPMDVTSWTRYIVGASVRSIGLNNTLRAFVRGRQAITQNRHIRANQDSGTYWLHDERRFKSALQEAGFQVIQEGTCYRDACDFAVCTTS